MTQCVYCGHVYTEADNRPISTVRICSACKPQSSTVTISADLSDAYVRLQRAVEAYLELGNSARMKRMNMALEDVRKAGTNHA
jgi:hypothetical protein